MLPLNLREAAYPVYKDNPLNHLNTMKKFAYIALVAIISSCGNSNDEPKSPDIPQTSDKTSTAGFDKYSESNIFSRNVKLKLSLPMQGFSLDSDGSVWYTQSSKQNMYISKAKPNKGVSPVDAVSELMTLTYCGHGTNTAIEEVGADRYVWAGCFGSANANGEYWTEKLIGRVKFEKGKTVVTDDFDEYYYIGEQTDMHPSIDAEHDLLTINYGGTGTSNDRSFKVYKLSEAKNAPKISVEVSCTDGFRTGKAGSTAKTTITVRARDLTALTPVATPKFPKQGYGSAGSTYYSWQGFDVNGDRLYYAEGNDNYGLTGGFGTPSYAYITVFDMKGKVVEERTQIKAIADADWTSKMGMSVFGMFESEGVKVKGDKIYLGFGARYITDSNTTYYQDILVYDKPSK